MIENSNSRLRQLYGALGGRATEPNAHDDDWTAREARRMAERICAGFQLHDERRRREAVEAFAYVDARQFPGISEADAREAARAYVDALWEKDTIEKHNLDEHGDIDPERIGAADWSPVQRALLRRSRVVGMHPRYAEQTTLAWRNHKAERDYWTPFMEAQTHELRVALDDPSFPAKPKDGQSGYGPLVLRYVHGVELHDMHTRESWEEAIDVMAPYFEAILAARERSDAPL